ncbi:sulfite exporter TauE/SafE family protein [Pseudobacillus sp. FSL P4-0506]|uniref:sulfite exporter TauE/SafE family protein n=1 Tax=unclassified Pseudobacillus TaxID=2619284 RepID=UPI0030FB3CC9
MVTTTSLLLFIIGIIAGGYGTIVGAGGGFIFVPVLLIVFQMEPTVAAGSGLVLVCINSIAGAIGYAKKKMIHYRIGAAVGMGALPSSIVGVWFLQSYPSNFFYILFASILIALGLFLLVKNVPIRLNRKEALVASSKGKSEHLSIRNKSMEPSLQNPARLMIIQLLTVGFFIGVLSSYLGIGGGWLLVPVLIYLFHISPHQAAATSVFSICLYSSIGGFFQFLYGHVDWEIVIWGGIGVTIGAHLGVISAQKLPSKMIIQMLSILLIVIGFRMYLN